ncbi:MAG: hypothetical protein RLN62_02870 [Rickettsiales bacterium]
MFKETGFKELVKAQTKQQKEIDILKRKIDELMRRKSRGTKTNHIKPAMSLLSNVTGLGRSNAQLSKQLLKLLF